MDIGAAKLVPVAGGAGGIGLTIDVAGNYVSAAAQSGAWGPKQVGEEMSDTFGGGGIYRVATTDNSVSSTPSIGNVTGWTIVRPSYVSGAPPCTTGCQVEGAGSPALINLTWIAPTGLDLNPTGKSVSITGLLKINGGKPTVNTCGTGGSVDPQAVDARGQATPGATAGTTCSLNFSVTLASPPYCVGNARTSAGVPTPVFIDTTATVLTLKTGVDMSSGKIAWHCEL